MNRTERFYKIDQMLHERRVVPIDVFLDTLAVLRATFKRDIEYLRDRLHAPIVWDRGAGGYRFESTPAVGPAYELPGLWFSSSELYALLAAHKLRADIQPGGWPLRLRRFRRGCWPCWRLAGIRRRTSPSASSCCQWPGAPLSRVSSRISPGPCSNASASRWMPGTGAQRDQHPNHFAPAPGLLPRQLVPRCLVPPAPRPAQFRGRCDPAGQGAAPNRARCGGDQAGCAFRLGLRHFWRAAHGLGGAALFAQTLALGSIRALAWRAALGDAIACACRTPTSGSC